jgi:Mn-dependent DtxR family transcriptional regulator
MSDNIESVKTGIVMLLNTQPNREWDYGEIADALNVDELSVLAAIRELHAEGVVEGEGRR